MSHDGTVELVSQALDVALMRQTAITSNVANANTLGYHALSIAFEKQFNLNSELPSTPVLVETNSPVKLEEQVALSIQNATQFRALIKGLNHHLAIMNISVHGNNA